MKSQHNALLIFLLFSSFPVLAQDWSLFPYGQRSMYGIQEDTLIHFQILQCDSQSTDIDQRTDHFVYSEANEKWKGCVDAHEEYNMYFANWNISSPISTLDSIVYTGGVAHIYGVDIDQTMLFFTAAQVDDTFHLLPDPYTDIYTKCIFIGEGEVLGQTDSIKRFAFFKDGGSSVLEDRILVLSKHAGLVSFYHFSELAQFEEGTEPAFFELLGKETDIDTVGYSIPAWAAFLPYFAGDILVWDLQDYAWGITTHRYAKDSITSVSIYPDSLVYHFNRVIKNTDGTLVNYPDQHLLFDRSTFSGMLQSIPDLPVVSTSTYPWFGLDPIWIWQSAVSDLAITDTDTITYRSFYWSGSQLDTTTCVYVWAVDIDCNFGMNDQIGVTHFGTHYSDGIGTEWVLIGRTLQGEVWGNIDFDALQISTVDKNNILISPDPAEYEIHLSLPNDHVAQYSIRAVHGAIVQEGTIQNNTVDIHDLRTGMYVIQCVQDDAIYIGTFIKK